MTLLLKVACPDCGRLHDSAPLGAELRCVKCGRDFRAQGDGEGASRIVSATPDDMDSVPYSQRCIEVPVNSVSSLIVADPALLYDKLLRDTPLRENTRWVGKVRLLKKLGQGGMGSVYRGYDESLALDVAVKVLPVPSGARDDQFVQRFRQEARISARINHPNVVRTLHVDEQGDLIYLVMDFIEGQTARSLVDSKGPLMLPLALQIIHDATLGMQAAHAHGVIHRDIKPDNILIADDGRVLLSDLGLAKAISTGGRSPRMPVTRLGLLLGTPEYMSPEQWDIGAEIGPATDIWSMGATLWMLLTQRPPFDEKDMGILARQVKEAPPPDIRLERPTLPDSVLDILQHCLEKRPADRFADSAELLRAVDAALEDLAAGRVVITPRLRPRTPTPVRLPAVTAPPPPPAPAPASPTGVSSLPTGGTLSPALPPPPTKSSVRRLAPWAAVFVVAVTGSWMVFNHQRRAAPATSQPAVSLELRCSTHVKPGQEAELSALIGGANPSDYAVMWLSGEKAYGGGNVRVPLHNDTDFTVVVRNKNTAREVARRDVKVAVELQVHAAEKDFHEIVAGTPLKFAGEVRGGGDAQEVEARWVEFRAPETPLTNGTVLDLAEKNMFQEPGRYTFLFQAKRKSTPGWTDAAVDKVVVQVNRRVPTEFTAAMQEGAQARTRALQAATGTEALAAWKEALGAFEKAGAAFTDEEAQLLGEQCRQRVALEEKYAGLLAEGRRRQEAAQAAPPSDSVRRLAVWSEALRPCSAAVVLFDRDEARDLAGAVEARVKELKAALESAEDERTTFERIIAKARHSAKEASKYVNPSVALPHWEDALSGFQELSKRFPKRTDEFALELKEAQENRDKAFLYDSMGIVPGRSASREPTPPPKPVTPTPQPKPDVKK